MGYMSDSYRAQHLFMRGSVYSVYPIKCALVFLCYVLLLLHFLDIWAICIQFHLERVAQGIQSIPVAIYMLIYFWECKVYIRISIDVFLDSEITQIIKMLPCGKQRHIHSTQSQCQKFGKIFTGPMYKLFLKFTIILDVYRSFIRNKISFTKCCLIQWISKLPLSFQIHWVRQYLINFTGLASLVLGLGTGKFSHCNQHLCHYSSACEIAMTDMGETYLYQPFMKYKRHEPCK